MHFDSATGEALAPYTPAVSLGFDPEVPQAAIATEQPTTRTIDGPGRWILRGLPVMALCMS
jgi:hypothetical protein